MKNILLPLLCSFIFNTLSAQSTLPSAEEIVKRVADNVIAITPFTLVNQKTNESFTSLKGITPSSDIILKSEFNDWGYWNGVLSIAMVQLSKLLNEKKYSEHARQKYDFMFNNVGFFKKQYQVDSSNSPMYQFFRMDCLDDCGAIAAGLADVNDLYKSQEYITYLKKAAAFITSKQVRLKDGTLVRPDPRPMTLWADDLYMSVPFLARMGKLTGNKKYFDDAILQVENFTEYLYDKNDGLFYHCWYSTINMNGVAHWGRCNGWLMMAQVELLKNLPLNHPKRKHLINLLLQQIVGVSRYQDITGLWHQLLDKPDSYLESSATAMFTYSIAKAVNEGWIDKGYLSIAINGWDGLTAKINTHGQVEDICTGTGIQDNLKFYATRPAILNEIHGLGPVILAGVEIIKAQARQ